ncbi:MAG: ATP-binding protein [Candidatus Moranbacteria bacterium]|nr:ATP-binding protein [Candidatus Moranbacteria bacterium]
MNKKIENFYIEWKANLDDYLSGYIFNEKKELRKTRFVYIELKKYLDDLLNNSLSEENKIIVLPGIRGVGKTTLLSQLYFYEKFNKTKNNLDEKIYISVDRLLSEKISLQEFISYLEKNIWSGLSNSSKKILLLIDEIQYDEKWDLFLKLLFDKTKGNNNILIVATGSSAIFLNQKNKDLVRRSKTKRILPEKFSENLFLHENVELDDKLSKKIKNSIFNKNNAEEVYNSLVNLQSSIVKELSKIKNLQFIKNNYFLRGAFPFSAEMENKSSALERIKNMVLTNIIQRDLILSGDFDAETLVRIPDVLFLLANSSEISTGNLANTLKIHSSTVNKILASLVDAEILFEVKPYGQPYKQVKKSSKYLFISSNIRAGLLNGIFGDDIKGSLLEDYVALICSKELFREIIVYYDYGSGGADFILRFSSKDEIVIEIGFGKEEIKQVEKTILKSNNRTKYGIVIGSEKLDIIGNIVKIPLDYFLLV